MRRHIHVYARVYYAKYQFLARVYYAKYQFLVTLVTRK